jgi:hypothetical protein
MSQQAAAAPQAGKYDRAKDDAKIESQFLADYLVFGLQINWNCIRTLVEHARKAPNGSLLQKSLCVSGLQVMYSSWEDFALLLHAIRARKESNKALHCTLGADKDSREGSAFMPKVYKRFRSSREVLDDLGFSSISLERLREFGIDMTQAELDSSLQEFAASIKGLGDYQTQYNDIKNRLKHGKGVIGDYQEDRHKADFITALDWHNNNGSWELTLTHHSASLQQLEIAAIHVAKLLIRSLDLLMFYAIQNYPEELKTLPRTIKKEGLRCAEEARGLGLNSPGLTTLLD